MEKINRDEVAYVANLARLTLDGEAVIKFTTQLNKILLYMDKLNEVDTTVLSRCPTPLPGRTPSVQTRSLHRSP